MEEVSVRSSPGGGLGPNQDRALQVHGAVGICDGHGELGAVAAQAACEYLETFLDLRSTRDALAQNSVSHVMKRAFEGAHCAVQSAMKAEIESRSISTKVDEDGVVYQQRGEQDTWIPVRGGTTCTLAVRLPGKWVVAHVGDSPALWIPEEGPPRMLLHDHSPDSVEEAALLWQRAQRPGMQLLYDVPPRTQGARQAIYSATGEKMAPQPGRYYVKNVKKEPAVLCATPAGTTHMFYLAMLRSLGDFALHPLGLTHEPSIVEVEGNGRLALFSDGITDVFTDEQLATLASAHESVDTVAENVMHEATRLARQFFGDTMDDRTLVLAE